MGGRDGDVGAAGSVAYSYTGNNFSANLGALYRERHYAQLTDLTSSYRARSSQYASVSLYGPRAGTLTATYTAVSAYDGPDTKLANVGYTLGLFGGKGLLALNYTRTMEPQTSNTWLLSFRYFFDTVTSVVGAVGKTDSGSTQALSLQKGIPQGEGIGYELTAGRVDYDGSDAFYGRAFAQVNAPHLSFGAEYQRAGRADAVPGLSRAFVAGSLGYVGGRVFAAQPVFDSFALVRVPDVAGVPVYANGWFVGNTNADGEVVATNIASYYDNFVRFDAKDLALDYVFPTAESVISPPTRSGTLVAFAIRKQRAVFGTLATPRNGREVAVEFREIVLTRDGETIKSFTARRGEFYVEGVAPGDYQLRAEGEPPCVGRLTVPESGEPLVDLGRVVCTR
jgi:outer membrane usher protein FimD/PapC